MCLSSFAGDIKVIEGKASMTKREGLAEVIFLWDNAQGLHIEQGSLRELAKAGIANFEVDYSKAIIHGMPEEEFAEYELDWDKDIPQITRYFRNYLTERAGLTLVSKKKVALTLRWVVISINTKGDTKSELHVLDSNGTILAKIVDLYGEGGTFGS